MWHTHQSKELFDHPKLSIIEDEVELPNGKRTTYLRFKDTGNGVILICRNAKGEILMIQEYAYPVGGALLQFPGGFVPFGETLETGANRELMEEAKLRAARLKEIGSFWTNSRRSSAKTHIFIATEFQDDALPFDEDEDIQEYRWLSEDAIEQMIYGGETMSGYALAAWTIYKNAIMHEKHPE